MIFSQEDIRAFQNMAESFAEKSIRPVLGHDTPDGDLARVPALMEKARENGLIASSNPEAPGHETGIWGRFAKDMGPRVSLLLLEELAAACGGVALNAHVLGLSALVAGSALECPEVPENTAVALLEGGFAFTPEVLRYPSRQFPAAVETVAEDRGDEVALDGRKDFVCQAEGTRAYIVFARTGDEWRAFLADTDAHGLKAESAGRRMGLRSAPVVHLVLEDVRVGKERELQFGHPGYEAVLEYLRFYWLGNLAIATGVARGALDAALAYARERYQCCTEIINHPGVNSLLLGKAEAGIAACQSLLDRASAGSGESFRNVAEAAGARLAGLDHAARAVTDCLQAFGGYGYMEDYGMEKRYRDVNTLKCMGGGPRDMKAVIVGFREGW
ncbi:MAG: acyl-CoA dehydrogenase [bacterium]